MSGGRKPSPVPRSALAEDTAASEPEAVEETAAETPEEADQSGSRADARGDAAGAATGFWSGRTPVVVAFAVGAVSLAAAVTFGLLWWLGEGKAKREEVVSTAERYAEYMSSHDYRSLAEHRRRVLEFSTDRFDKVFRESVAAFDDLLVEGKSKAKATVHRAGLAELTDDRAVVILFVDQEITNKLVTKPRIDRNRVVMTLSEVDGEWLVDDVDLE